MAYSNGCRFGDSARSETLLLLIDDDASLLVGSKPVLLLAIHANNISVIEFLLKAGADPNGTDEKRPFVEVRGRNEHIISVLLEYGADPYRPMNGGMSTVFHELCGSGYGVQPIVAMGHPQLPRFPSQDTAYESLCGHIRE